MHESEKMRNAPLLGYGSSLKLKKVNRFRNIFKKCIFEIFPLSDFFTMKSVKYKVFDNTRIIAVE